jgi:SAM-dependent methyltransferase
VTRSDWLADTIDALPPGARVLDVASGSGRNALFVAATGRPVHAIDRDRQALAALAERARVAGVPVTTEVVDLEAGMPALGTAIYGGVIVFNYLHRPLLPAIVHALAPGGVLIYETFTIGQAARGHPRNPAFLLQPGELRDLVQPLTVMRYREGEVRDTLVASIVARK